MRLRFARAKLREIVSSANEDPEYMERLQSDPVDVLVGEGLPYDVIEDFLSETGLQGEVSGYMMESDCANSCALTNIDDYGF